MSFLADGIVPNGKTTLYPIPATADANKYVSAAEWNSICAALLELRDHVAVTGTTVPPGTTRGDVLTWSGSDWQLVAAGSAGQVLTALNPEFSPPVQFQNAAGGSSVSIATTNGISGGTITTTGTLSLDLAYSPTWTGTHTFAKSAVATGSTNAVTLDNPSAATSGSQQQFSPTLKLTTSAWDQTNTVAKAMSWELQARGLQGTAAAVGADLVFWATDRTGSRLERFAFTTGGGITTPQVDRQFTLKIGHTNTSTAGWILDLAGTPGTTNWAGSQAISWRAGNGSASQEFLSFRPGSTTQGMAIIGFGLNDGVQTTQLTLTNKGLQSTMGFYSQMQALNAASGAVSVSAVSGEMVRVVMTGNVTSMTLATGKAGQIQTIQMIQDATGSRTYPGSGWVNVKHGPAWTATTTANRRDVFTFRWDDSDAAWVEIARSLNVT